MTWTAKHPWWPDALRRRSGLITRAEATRRGVPHILKGSAEQAELDRFAAWRDWRYAGGARPRALDGWRPEPVYWTVLNEYERKHPRAPRPKPHPGPVPVSPWTADQVGGFGFRLAWVFTNGARTGGYTPESLVDRVRNAREPHTGQRIRFLSLEDYPATENRPFHDRLRDACHNAGLQYRLWARADQENTFEGIKEAVDRYKPDVLECDIEDFPMQDQSMPLKIARAFPNLPRVTLQAGFSDGRYQERDCWPWYHVDQGNFACWTQAYAHEAWPSGVPGEVGRAGGMDRDAYWRGVPELSFLPGLHTMPMIGVNQEGDQGIEHQLPAVKMFAPHWGIEWFESCEPADLELLGC